MNRLLALITDYLAAAIDWWTANPSLGFLLCALLATVIITATVALTVLDDRRRAATIGALVHAGVVGPWHYRWGEMCDAAAALDLTPENAVYRAHDGRWSEYHVHPDDTAADFIREAATR